MCATGIVQTPGKLRDFRSEDGTTKTLRRSSLPGAARRAWH